MAKNPKQCRAASRHRSVQSTHYKSPLNSIPKNIKRKPAFCNICLMLYNIKLYANLLPPAHQMITRVQKKKKTE